MCFYCCRQIVMLCSCRTRLQQAPLTTTLPGLVGSLLRWAWGWQGHSLANSPAVVVYWVPYATFCPPSCFSPAHLGTDVFPHLTPSSLIKLLDAYCWSSQEQGGWDSAMAGGREERAFIEALTPPGAMASDFSSGYLQQGALLWILHVTV